MKMTKLLALLLALVMAVGVLASCGKDKDKEQTEPDPTTFGDYLNTNYNTYADVVSSLTEVSELEGYEVEKDNYTVDQGNYSYDMANNKLVLLSKTDLTTTTKTYKLFSLTTGKVVATFSNYSNTTTGNNSVTTYNTSYSFEMATETESNGYIYTVEDVPAIMVTKVESTTVTPAVGFPDTDSVVTNYLYDASGASVVSQQNSFIDAPYVFDDWVIFEDVVYTVNKETGALTKKCDVPTNFGDDYAFIDRNDTYIYALNYTYSAGTFVVNDVIVYDYDFKVVAIWSTPANALFNNAFVLNDGNVFIQYKIALDPNAPDYEIFEGSTVADMKKFDLVTEIFSVAQRTGVEIDFNYIVADGNSRYSLNKDAVAGEEEYATEAFENVVTVYPIADKRIDFSEARMDFLIIDNEGTVVSSLKLVEYQTDLPIKIATDKYLVETLYGTSIVDVNGQVLTQFNDQNVDLVGDYLVGNYAIYDMSFAPIYDFSAKNAYVIDILNDTIFVKEYTNNTRDDYKIIGFAKGKQIDVCTYDADKLTGNLSFDYDVDMGIYSLYNAKSGEYTYYNADGTKLATISAKFDGFMSEVNDTVYLARAEKKVTTVGGGTDTVVTYFVAK